MTSIPFTKNWNNKLESEFFTTIRLWNPQKYRPGQNAQIVLNQKAIFNVTILDTKKLKINDINDWIACLDAGMNAQKLKAMFLKMYGNKGVADNDIELVWMLCQRHKF